MVTRIRPATKVQPVPGTSGGALVASAIGAATTNATIVKAASGILYGIDAVNINAAVRYLKIYNKATAPSETDVPVMRIALQGGATGPRSPLNWPNGIQFSAGISYRLVTGIVDADTGAPSSSESLVNIFYL